MAPALTFSDISPITPLTSHSYTTLLKDSWSIGAVPNGGYVTSLFLLVARKHMSLNHAARNQPDPINLHLEFLRRTSAATAAVFTVQDVKIGSRTSNLHVTLSQTVNNDDGVDGNTGKKCRDNVQGYITMSNLTTETGLTLPTSFTLHPAPAGPVDLSFLASPAARDEHYILQPPLSFPKFRKAAQHIRVYLPRADRQAKKKKKKKKSYLDQWVRFHPEGHEGRWTNDALGYVVDMFPQLVEEYLMPREEEGDQAGGASAASAASSLESTTAAAAAAAAAVVQQQRQRPQAKFWYPTLSLNLDVRRPLPANGVDWLFVRVGSKVVRNGRMDLEVLVFDELGQIVATSTHQALIMGTERNVAGRGYKEGKEKGEGGGRSKL